MAGPFTWWANRKSRIGGRPAARAHILRVSAVALPGYRRLDQLARADRADGTETERIATTRADIRLDGLPDFVQLIRHRSSSQPASCSARIAAFTVAPGA